MAGGVVPKPVNAGVLAADVAAALPKTGALAAEDPKAGAGAPPNAGVDCPPKTAPAKVDPVPPKTGAAVVVAGAADEGSAGLAPPNTNADDVSAGLGAPNGLTRGVSDGFDTPKVKAGAADVLADVGAPKVRGLIGCGALVLGAEAGSCPKLKKLGALPLATVGVLENGVDTAGAAVDGGTKTNPLGFAAAS